MKPTIDNQKLQIKEKLEALLENLEKVREEGIATAKLHQLVIDSIKTENEEDKKAIEVYVEATKQQLAKTEEHLKKVDARIEFAKDVVAKLDDDEFLSFAAKLLVFIGAEEPDLIEKA